MPRNVVEVLSSPRDIESSITIVSSSKTFEKSTANVQDVDFRNSLRFRNIYINREDPSIELTRRAKTIITRLRASPEMDDITAQKLRDTARRLETEGEEIIVQKFVSHLFPAMNGISDQRLDCNANQAWCDAVPIPLDPDVLANPLSLPRPKPDLVFGYSETAFDHKKLMTIDLLIDQFERSYAMPDKKLRFPFLDIEFKSQAKNGTHFIATNQIANASSIAMNGVLELIRRVSEEENFDINEPQFFSLSLDHAYACVNVHWLGVSPENGSFSFHVEELSKHFLNDVNGLRAVRRAVKNILDYGVNDRLATLCKLLDTYRQKIIVERKSTLSEGHRTSEVQVELQTGRSRRRTNRRHKQSGQSIRRVLEDIIEDDGIDESQEQLQGGMITQDERATTRRTKSRSSTQRQDRTSSSVRSIRTSSRIATRARVQGTAKDRRYVASQKS